MNRTQRIESSEIDKALAYDQEPRYPLIERTETAQLGATALHELEVIDDTQ